MALHNIIITLHFLLLDNYTFEKRYYVFDRATRFVCLVCVCVCVSVCLFVCLSSRLWRDGWTKQYGVK